MNIWMAVFVDMYMCPGEISKQALVSNHYELNTFYHPFNMTLASVTEKEAWNHIIFHWTAFYSVKY